MCRDKCLKPTISSQRHCQQINHQRQFHVKERDSWTGEILYNLKEYFWKSEYRVIVPLPSPLYIEFFYNQ